jgi:sugar lactone lactonase YvrE
MKATRIPRLARRGSAVLSVALLAMAGLAGARVADHPGFPAYIHMIDTPSGIAVDKPGNVYVSVREPAPGPGLLGRSVIYKYTRDGTPSFFANMGSGAVVYGLFVTPDGHVYVAMATGPDQGVYRLDRRGNAELLPGSEQMVFPNGLAFDDRGNLYVTESNSGSPGAYGQGGIWRIPPGGEAELWVRDALLTGTGVTGAPVGANGIGYYHGALYVTNTDKGLVAKIPIAKDGTAGPVELWKRLDDVRESPLFGAKLPIMPDGLAIDVHGNLYMTILTRNAIVRLMADDRSQASIAVLGSPGPVPSARFDTPASLAFGTGAGEQQNLFVTNLGWMVKFIPERTWPGPALLKVAAGAPGRPL